MSAAKFLGIITTVLEQLKVDSPSRLFFEFAPDNGPMQKLGIQSIANRNSKIEVVLAAEHAACKPLQRLAGTLPQRAASAVPSAGCCTDASKNSSKACCG